MFPEQAVQYRADAVDALRLSNDRTLTTLGFGALLIPALWYVRADIASAAGDWEQLMRRLMLRLVLVAVAVGGLITMRVVDSRDAYSRAALWLGMITAIVTVGLNALRPAGSGLPLRTPMLILAVMYFAMPSTFWRQCLAPLLMSAGVVVLRLTRLSGGPVDMAGDMVALISINALGLLAVARRLALKRETAQVVVELRALQGVIPICSYCRKVRSEVGDWQQLERYVHEHSDSAFSHGICPDCLQAHHGEHTT